MIVVAVVIAIIFINIVLIVSSQMREMIRKAEERHRIPELEEFLKSEVYEDSDHTVTITDLSSSKTDADADADHQVCTSQ